MIRTILIEDEPIALKHLTALLLKHCPQILIVATAATIEEAKLELLSHHPELVLLDIELSGHNSFELLEQVNNLDFEKIFVTAHEQFGIQAIKHRATDYILKPIDKLDLTEAVERAASKIYAKRMLANQKQIIEFNLNYTHRLSLPAQDGLIFVDIQKIMYCESEGRYTRFYLANQEKKILVSKNIGEYEILLPKHIFIRIHSHYIVNLSYVEKYVKGRGGHVVLTNGTQLDVSVRKKDDFLGIVEG